VNPLAVVVGAAAATTLVRNAAYWTRMWRQPTRIADERRRAAVGARAAADRRIEIHYVIPAFQEVESLPATFLALRRAVEAAGYAATITVVTSIEDEPRSPGEVRTRQVAEELCATMDGARVIVDRSPVPSMAAAFNTGMRDVAARRRADGTTAYIAVYNADSSATPDSVQALGDTILARGLPEVLQVNFASMRNLSAMSGADGWLARGAAYYQTRWALGFEFDLHRRNSRAVRRGPLGHSYHLKGHGAVLRLDVALAAGGFSTETPCEDLELGFRLAMQRIPVHSVPVLEDTESPASTRAVIAQKRYWFSGMVDVASFHRLQPDLREAEPVRFELSRAASVYRSAACFLLAPVPYLVLIAGGAVLRKPALALIPLVNAGASTWLIRRALSRLDPGTRPLGLRHGLSDAAAVAAWSMCRNIGPALYVLSMLRQRDRTARMRRAHVAHIDESAVAVPVPVVD
jgi:hypothetical protein